MAKDSIYSILQKPVTEHGRNIFPLDNRHIYSMKAGQITPIKALHFKPGDYFDIQTHDFTLTFPMNTAAFLRGRKETAFYSVYYNAIWSLYNQYQATRKDAKTSAFDANDKLVEPRIPLYDMLYCCWGQWIKYLYYEYYLAYYAEINSGNVDTIRKAWLDVVANYAPTSIDASTDIQTYMQVWLNARVSGDFQTAMFVRSDFYHSSIAMRDYVLDIVGHFRAYSWLRKLDMLGYGNYYPLFSHAESIITSFTEPTDSTSLGLWLDNMCEIACSLLIALAESCWRYDGTLLTMQEITFEKNVNLYPICAYNSIFYHFFRNSFYDNNYYTHDYSLDFVSTQSSRGQFNSVQCSDFDLRFLDIEYHQWKKDRFTGVLPDQQFGSVSGLTLDIPASVTGSDENRWKYSQDGSTIPASSAQVESYAGALFRSGDGGIKHDHFVPVNSTGFDVIALKRAEMLQEYRQLLMRAGNKTTDIFRAIYGESCSSEHVDDIIPRFMDTFGEDMFVDPVTSTAQTDASKNGDLGDLSARAKFSGSSGRIKFNAGGNFGLILALTYVVPTSEYNSYMTDKHVFELTPEDHFIPQFENTGLQDIYNFELNCLLPYNDAQSLGKAPRYYHKKTEVDMVHGAFCSLPKNIKRGQTFPLLYSGLIRGEWFGAFNHWVSPRSELQGRLSTALRDFYINPSVLDNVFVQAAGPDQSQDQFICNTYLEVRSTKEMSKIGLPNFV